MKATPSLLLADLHGSAAHLTVRRHRGLHIVEARRLDAVPPVPATIIIDNLDPGYSEPSGNWFSSTTRPYYHATDYRTLFMAAGTEIARWTPTLPKPAPYTLYVWNPQSIWPQRNVIYTVYHDQGSTPYAYDQNAHYGQWTPLGTHDLTPGSTRVDLTFSMPNVPLADAIRWVQKFPIP